VQNFALKFQAVAEKTAKNIRGLLYFAAPCISECYYYLRQGFRWLCFHFVCACVCLSLSLSLSLCVCVCVCQQDVSESCRRMLMIFSRGAGCANGNRWSDFGSDPDDNANTAIFITAGQGKF